MEISKRNDLVKPCIGLITSRKPPGKVELAIVLSPAVDLIFYSRACPPLLSPSFYAIYRAGKGG